MAPGGKQIARHLFAPKDSEKDRRLNRIARRFDPPPPHQVRAIRRFPPAFAPSSRYVCQDPLHQILYARGRIATTEQLRAAGIKFPVNAFRRQRAGGWGWVKINRPDGQPLIPYDAGKVPYLDHIDFLGYGLTSKCGHPVDQFCRHCCHGSPRAIRPSDDGWEDISWLGGPPHLREAHGRRPIFRRHRPGGPLYQYHDDGKLDNHQHRPQHHRRHPHHRDHLGLAPYVPHRLDPEYLYHDTDFSDWLAAGAMAHPRHHAADHHLIFRPARPHRQELLNTPTIATTATDDDDSFYVCDTDEEEVDEFDEDVYSDIEIYSDLY